MKQDFRSAALYIAAFLPVCVCALLLTFAVIDGMRFLDLRGDKGSVFLALFPLALACAMYSMLANWFRAEGWFRPGARSHFVRSAPMYVIALSLGWVLHRSGSSLEDYGLVVFVSCGVALAAIVSDVVAWLRRPDARLLAS